MVDMRNMVIMMTSNLGATYLNAILGPVSQETGVLVMRPHNRLFVILNHEGTASIDVDDEDYDDTDVQIEEIVTNSLQAFSISSIRTMEYGF